MKLNVTLCLQCNWLSKLIKSVKLIFPRCGSVHTARCISITWKHARSCSAAIDTELACCYFSVVWLSVGNCCPLSVFAFTLNAFDDTEGIWVHVGSVTHSISDVAESCGSVTDCVSWRLGCETAVSSMPLTSVSEQPHLLCEVSPIGLSRPCSMLRGVCISEYVQLCHHRHPQRSAAATEQTQQRQLRLTASYTTNTVSPQPHSPIGDTSHRRSRPHSMCSPGANRPTSTRSSAPPFYGSQDMERRSQWSILSCRSDRTADRTAGTERAFAAGCSTASSSSATISLRSKMSIVDLSSLWVSKHCPYWYAMFTCINRKLL